MEEIKVEIEKAILQAIANVALEEYDFILEEELKKIQEKILSYGGK